MAFTSLISNEWLRLVLGARTLPEKLILLQLGYECAEQDEDRDQRDRHDWFIRSVMKKSPKLSGGFFRPRGGKFYGRRSNYGGLHEPALSPLEFYNHFRFQSKDIDRLCQALRIPTHMLTRSKCRINGEEALLIFLKVPYIDNSINTSFHILTFMYLL